MRSTEVRSCSLSDKTPFFCSTNSLKSVVRVSIRSSNVRVGVLQNYLNSRCNEQLLLLSGYLVNGDLVSLVDCDRSAGWVGGRKGLEVSPSPAGGAFVGIKITVWKVGSCCGFSKVLATSIASSLEKHSDHLWLSVWWEYLARVVFISLLGHTFVWRFLLLFLVPSP